MTRSRAVILVGHGSRVDGFERALRRAARALQKRLKDATVRIAYLEINTPHLGEAIDGCIAAGASTVEILPYFLLTGRHVVRDIPGIAAAARVKHGRRVRIAVRPYLGFDSRIVDVLIDRLKAAR